MGSHRSWLSGYIYDLYLPCVAGQDQKISILQDAIRQHFMHQVGSGRPFGNGYFGDEKIQISA
jgi:hypothetical protein